MKKAILGITMLFMFSLAACAGIDDFAEDEFAAAFAALEDELSGVEVTHVEWKAADKYGVYEDGEIVLEEVIYGMTVSHDSYQYAIVYVEAEDMGATNYTVELFEDESNYLDAYSDWEYELSEDAFNETLEERGDLEEISRTYESETGEYDQDTIDSLLD